jgi:hypothetical protein
MLDDSLTAEMFGVLLEGIQDGGQSKIDGLYRRHDDSFDADGPVTQKLDVVVKFLVDNMLPQFVGTPLLRPAHFLMLFAAVAHALVGIPQGALHEPPQKPDDALENIPVTRENFLLLGSLIASEVVPNAFEGFWKASRSTTHRIGSRRIRFPFYLRALAATPF